MKHNDFEFDNYFKNYPDKDGYFGKYGGSYIPENLQKAMAEITEAYFTICKSSKFVSELRRIRKEFQGRPTPISHLERLSNSLGNVQLYVKREDLNHSGAHKLNHCMGEALLAKYMGKKKVIAETGAGQHGVALATAAAYFGLECDIYMGSVDIKKQAPNVARMKILGAYSESVDKDAARTGYYGSTAVLEDGWLRLTSTEHLFVFGRHTWAIFGGVDMAKNTEYKVSFDLKLGAVDANKTFNLYVMKENGDPRFGSIVNTLTLNFADIANLATANTGNFASVTYQAETGIAHIEVLFTTDTALNTQLCSRCNGTNNWLIDNLKVEKIVAP